MSRVRIATVVATGARFVVQQLDFKAERAHCWGHVTSFRGTASKHEASHSFRLSEVRVEKVERTPELLRGLFDQTLDARRTAGHVLTGRKVVTDHGTAEQREAFLKKRDAFTDRLSTDLATMLGLR